MRVPVALIAECRLVRLTDRGASFDVFEVLELDDGTRILLKSDRGFGGEMSSGPPGLEPAHLETGVSFCLLSDDYEQTGDIREWGWLAELAVERGISITPAELRSLPMRTEYVGLPR